MAVQRPLEMGCALKKKSKKYLVFFLFAAYYPTCLKSLGDSISFLSYVILHSIQKCKLTVSYPSHTYLEQSNTNKKERSLTLWDFIGASLLAVPNHLANCLQLRHQCARNGSCDLFLSQARKLHGWKSSLAVPASPLPTCYNVCEQWGFSQK